MRVLVLGAGATGGFFGGHLAKAGGDVTFLVRPPRAQQLAERGLIVESPRGNFSTPVKTIIAGNAATGWDVVLLSCKAYDLASAIDAIRPAVGADTRILPLLNGLSHLDLLDAAFGADRVLGGTCHISVTLSNSGVVQHLSAAYDALTQGPRLASQQDFCNRLHQDLQRGAFEARLSSDIVRTMWEKWVLLATMASMTCLYRANLGEIARTDHGAEIVSRTLDECCTVASSSGTAPAPAVVAQIRALLTDRGSTMASSMLRDLQAGARIEAGHIVGDLIARAQASGLDVPNLKSAYTALQAYQMQRNA